MDDHGPIHPARTAQTPRAKPRYTQTKETPDMNQASILLAFHKTLALHRARFSSCEWHEFNTAHFLTDLATEAPEPIDLQTKELIIALLQRIMLYRHPQGK
jgi:hypothetical protein